MAASFVQSSWEFVTSEGAEFDAAIFGASKGSIYVKDTNDPDGIVHELLYVSFGFSTGKGPIPFGIGGSFSTPDMYSSGTIYRHRHLSKLATDDFGGVGEILSASMGGGLGTQASYVRFGPGIWPRALAVVGSHVAMPPSISVSAQHCYFYVDP